MAESVASGRRSREGDAASLGAPVREARRDAVIDAYPGRASVTRLTIHARPFETPMPRDVALTTRCVHDCAYRALEFVVG